MEEENDETAVDKISGDAVIDTFNLNNQLFTAAKYHKNHKYGEKAIAFL